MKMTLQLIAFEKIGDDPIPTELINGELPPVVKQLEQFVCHVYCKTGPTTLPALRWELFRSKNLEGEMLPPTRAALLPHINRVNYIAMHGKSYPMNCPTLPPIEQNGWNVVENSCEMAISPCHSSCDRADLVC